MIDESHLKQLLRFHDRIQFRFIIANYSIAVSRMTVFWTALFPIFEIHNLDIERADKYFDQKEISRERKVSLAGVYDKIALSFKLMAVHSFLC